MPLDSQIALQTQGPADPLERYGKALALKNLIQQGKSQDLGLQQQQNDFDDQQKLKQAYTESGGDLIKTKQRAMQLGVNPKTLIKLEGDVLSQAKDMAELDEKKYTALKSKNELVGGKLKAVLSAPPDQQPVIYQEARSELIQQGLIDPAHAPEQFPGAPALKSMFDQTRTGSQMLEMADKIREAAFKEREVKASESNAASTAANAVSTGKRETLAADQTVFQNAISDLAGNPPANPAEYNARIGKLPPSIASRILQAVPVGAYDPAKSAVALRRMSMSGEQQTQADQAAANANQTRSHDEILEKVAKGHLSVAQADLELKKQQIGFETNGGISTTAQGIAEGRVDPATTRAIIRRNPGILNQVQQAFDPTGKDKWDEATGENRFNTLKEFTSTSTGKAGGQVLALNTLIHHADLYQQAAAALKNNSFRPGNAAYNAVANLFGSAPPTSASLVGRFLAGETGKVATGGVPAEGEIKGILSSLGNDASPEQIASAGKTLLQIASGRATPLMERVKNAKLEKQVQVIGPDAQEILKRNGFDPNTMKPAPVPSGITIQEVEAEIARRKKAK